MATASTDLVGTAKSFLPNITGVGSTVVTAITWLIILFLMVVVTCIVLFFYLQSKRYKYKLVIFEKINNVWVDTSKDRGMEVKFGKLGITVMYFRKLKRHEPFPKLQSGYRKFYFKKLPDGTLMNFKMDDHEKKEDETLMTMNSAMLFHHTGINKGLEQRFKKQDWKAYIPMVVGIMAIIIICIFVWLIMDKWMALSTSTNNGVKSAKEVLDSTNSILGKLDNLIARTCGGSGYVTPTTTTPTATGGG